MSRNTRITFAAAAIVAVAFVVWRRQRPAEQAPITEVAQPAAAPTAAPAPTSPAPDTSGQVNALRARVADEVRARQQAEAEAAALRAKVAPLESNVIVSLGKVEDIGKRTGQFLPALIEMEGLAKKDPATMTAEEKRRLLQLQRDQAQLLGSLPEITRFQDDPDQYGRFFSSMFQQAASLTDPQAAQVQEFMRQRAVLMNQQELNAAKEPTDPKLEEAWEERRDKFNEQTAEGLKDILPPGAAEKVNFGPELMEFLEMDFDKLAPKTPEQKRP